MALESTPTSGGSSTTSTTSEEEEDTTSTTTSGYVDAPETGQTEDTTTDSGGDTPTATPGSGGEVDAPEDTIEGTTSDDTGGETAPGTPGEGGEVDAPDSGDDFDEGDQQTTPDSGGTTDAPGTDSDPTDPGGDPRDEPSGPQREDFDNSGDYVEASAADAIPGVDIGEVFAVRDGNMIEARFTERGARRAVASFAGAGVNPDDIQFDEDPVGGFTIDDIADALQSERADLRQQFAAFEDEQATLREDIVAEAQFEAGQQSRADQAAFDDAVDVTRTVFSETTGEDVEAAGASGDVDIAGPQEAETYGAEVPELEEVTAQDAAGQQSVGDLEDQVLGPSAKPGGQGITDFLSTGATRTIPAARGVLNPGAADFDPDVVQGITDPAGSVFDKAVGAAAIQFSPIVGAGQGVADAADGSVEAIGSTASDVADVTAFTARGLDEVSGGIVGDTIDTGESTAEAAVDAATDATLPDVDAAIPDPVEDAAADVAGGVQTAASRGAAASLLFTLPFTRAAGPAPDVGTTSLDIGADAFDTGTDVARDLDEATDGRLGAAAGVLGAPLADTFALGSQAASTAEDVAGADESDFEDTADMFLENVLEEDERVTGGPLPVFSVATPGGVQTFLSGSDDAATAAQLSGGRGSAAAGGTASGGATGTAAASATDEAAQAAALATASGFVNELDVDGGEMFVDEQEVTGTESVFPDEKPIPDPQQIDVDPLGVPELGVRIGPSENQANTEIDELDIPTDSEGLFVSEVEVTMDDDTVNVTPEAGTAVGTGGGTGVGNQPGTGTGPGSTPSIGTPSGDVGDGGGFDVGGRPSPGLSIGSDSGVRFVGRTPNPESTLTDATDEFFGINLDDPFAGADILESAQQSVSGADASDGLFGGTDSFTQGTETGAGSEVATRGEGASEFLEDAPSFAGPESTALTDTQTEAPSLTGTGTGVASTPTVSVTQTPNEFDTPAVEAQAFEYAFPNEFASRPSRPPRPKRLPRISLPDPTEAAEDSKRRKDWKFADVFENPSISPEDAIDFNPLED